MSGKGVTELLSRIVSAPLGVIIADGGKKMDERIRKLAHGLVCHSTRIKKGEKVLITAGGIEKTRELVSELVREVYRAGGYPYVKLADSRVNREILRGVTEKQLEAQNDFELYQMKQMDAYIAVGCSDNTSEFSDVPAEKLAMQSRILDPVLRQRVDHSKWVILRYPNGSMAQAAGMSTEAFEDYYFNVCCLDYEKMEKAVEPLKELMDRTDRVRIVSPGTDISFSIKGIGSVPCCGECNIPDGEIYTAPVRDSVNGTITYNTGSEYRGFTFENVSLTFENGKIVNAEANDSARLNEILDTDEGARYVGEFALGINPYVTRPMLDILFDEKISGSIHFTPGCCYDDADNGNQSAVHWDLVLRQSAEDGGGEIYFDDVLVRKDGLFVLDELKGLNPENLK